MHFILPSLAFVATCLADNPQKPLNQPVQPLSQIAKYYHLPPLREQAIIQDTWTKERIDNVPDILNKYGVDAWLVIFSNFLTRALINEI
jgi:hypothetical protein